MLTRFSEQYLLVLELDKVENNYQIKRISFFVFTNVLKS